MPGILFERFTFHHDDDGPLWPAHEGLSLLRSSLPSSRRHSPHHGVHAPQRGTVLGGQPEVDQLHVGRLVLGLEDEVLQLRKGSKGRGGWR